MATHYTIKKTLLGKQIVVYQCPGCKEQLESDLQAAGGKDECPTCKRSMVVPGVKELNELREKEANEAEARASVERAKAESEAKIRLERAQRAKQDHEERERRTKEDRERRAVEAREQEERKAKEAAEAEVRAARDAELRKRREEEELLKASKFDVLDGASRFLWGAFVTVKYLSVLIVAACLLTAIGCIVGLLMLRPMDPSPPPPLQTPLFSSLKAEMSRESTPVVKSATASAKLKTEMQKISEAFLLSDAVEELLESAFSEADNKAAFKAGIESFLAEFQLNSGTGADAQPRIDQAVKWFVIAFHGAELSRRRAVEQFEVSKKLEQVRVAATRSTLLATLGGSIVALLAFIVIPLLIQIESNTRKQSAILSRLSLAPEARK